jgi:hypothetical protein
MVTRVCIASLLARHSHFFRKLVERLPQFCGGLANVGPEWSEEISGPLIESRDHRRHISDIVGHALQRRFYPLTLPLVSHWVRPL